jgi:hypothetical protein
MSHLEDRTFFHASDATPRMHGWFSVDNPAILICMFICVIAMIGMLILAAEGPSNLDWYDPALVNFVGP